LPPRDGIGEAKALAYRRAGRTDRLGVTVTEEFGFEGWIFAALAFVYGLAIMLTVIVTLAKSARLKNQREEESR